MKDKIKAQHVTFRLSNHVIQEIKKKKTEINAGSDYEGLSFQEWVFYAFILETVIHSVTFGTKLHLCCWWVHVISNSMASSS